MEQRYILYGTKGLAKNAVLLLGADRFDFAIRPEKEEGRAELSELRIFDEASGAERYAGQTVMLAVSSKLVGEAENAFAQRGIRTVRFKELRKRIILKKLREQPDYIGTYRKAIEWIHSNTVPEAGVINSTKLPLPYPEVTGYFIPTLLRWGYRELALSYARWLCRIQKPDGSWYDTEDRHPYIFDTAQVLKGLLSVRALLPEADSHIRRGCDWLLSYMREDGRLVPAVEGIFEDGNTMDEVIHLYCLSPLAEAADAFKVPEYRDKARRILNYYKEHCMEQIRQFSLLSHFYAYVMEGLLDMGETELVREAMGRIARLQRPSGAIPAYADVDWVCSTGIFQLALVWFRLGETDRGNRAFEYACKLQNPSGGWFGSYASEKNPGEKNTYFHNAEISWAVKYFLDALYWRNKAQFEEQAPSFRDSYPSSDGRYWAVENAVRACLRRTGPDGVKIADIGCGKGAYLKNLAERVPGPQYYGVDLSEAVLRFVGVPEISLSQGSLTNLPFPDGSLDFVYACESLEHAVDMESAVRELCRVTKPGGSVLILDKNRERLGAMEIEEWEQWFDADELAAVLGRYCDGVSVNREIGYDGKDADGLFFAWTGSVKDHA